MKKLRKEGSERGIDGVEYQARLREQHAKITRSSVAWADAALLEEKKQRKAVAKRNGDDSLDSAAEESDEDEENDASTATYQDAEALMEEALRSTGALMASRNSGALQPGKLSIGRVKDSNFHERTKAR